MLPATICRSSAKIESSPQESSFLKVFTMVYDVAIIGGGITGSAIARELMRYRFA